MAAGGSSPCTPNIKSYSTSTSLESFDVNCCSAAMEDAEEPSGALEGPDADECIHEWNLGQFLALAMEENADDCGDAEDLVDVEEGFVEGVADDGY